MALTQLGFQETMKELETLSLNLKSFKQVEKKINHVLFVLNRRLGDTRAHVIHKIPLALQESDAITKLITHFDRIRAFTSTSVTKLETEYMSAMETFADHTREVQKKKNLIAMCEALLQNLKSQDEVSDLSTALVESATVFEAFPVHLRPRLDLKSGPTSTLPAPTAEMAPSVRKVVGEGEREQKAHASSHAAKSNAVLRSRPFKFEEHSPQAKAFLKDLLPAGTQVSHMVQVTKKFDALEFLVENCAKDTTGVTSDPNEDKNLSMLLVGYQVPKRNVHVSLIFEAEPYRYPTYLRQFFVAKYPTHALALQQLFIETVRDQAAFMRGACDIFTEQSRLLTRPQDIVHGQDIDTFIPPLYLLPSEAQHWFFHNNTLAERPMRVASANAEGQCETCMSTSMFFGYKHCKCRAVLNQCFSCALREFFNSAKVLDESAHEISMAHCNKCAQPWAIESLHYVPCEGNWFSRSLRQK